MRNVQIIETITGKRRIKAVAVAISILILAALSGCSLIKSSNDLEVFKCAHNNIPRINMEYKGVELDHCITGDIAQRGTGSVVIANSKTGNIAENGNGDLIVRDQSGSTASYSWHNRSITGDIAESGSGNVIVWGSGSDAKAETGNIVESMDGDIIIKDATVGNVWEAGDGNVLLCAGSEVGDVREDNSGNCIYVVGAQISGDHYCQAVPHIPECD